MEIRNNEKIAIIASYSIDHCMRFCKHYGLNPEAFILVDRPEKLQGLDSKIPLIVTSMNRELNSNLWDFLEHRFKSVRYINY